MLRRGVTGILPPAAIPGFLWGSFSFQGRASCSLGRHPGQHLSSINVTHPDRSFHHFPIVLYVPSTQSTPTLRPYDYLFGRSPMVLAHGCYTAGRYFSHFATQSTPLSFSLTISTNASSQYVLSFDTQTLIQHVPNPLPGSISDHHKFSAIVTYTFVCA